MSRLRRTLRAADLAALALVGVLLVDCAQISSGRTLMDMRSGGAPRRSLQQRAFESGNDKCSGYGKVAAITAAFSACHALRVRCAPNAGGSAVSEAAQNTNPYEGLSAECIPWAQTACRTNARGHVTEDSDPACWRLLVQGPDSPVSGCASHQEAIDEFNWSIKEVCMQGSSIILQGVDPGDPIGR